MTLKEMLYKEDGSKKIVNFIYYNNGNLMYETEDHFMFPVPIDDIGNATFKATDYAPLFMRYIRKHIEFIDRAKENV